jgi:hypothetical protein
MRTACYLLLMFVSPGKAPRPIAVILFDPEQDALHWRFRDDWNLIADEDDVEVLSCLAEDFALKVQETSPESFLAYLEDTLSNCLQLTERSPVLVGNADEAVDGLFESLVGGR